MQIDTARFLQDLDTLRQLGTYRSGVHRPTFSPEDMESRHWLLREMQSVGLDATIDCIGNVLGRHKETGPLLLVGSHLEPNRLVCGVTGCWFLCNSAEAARFLQKARPPVRPREAAAARPARVRSRIDAWLNDVRHSGLHALRRFAQDIDAVRNAGREEWSNGQTEGQVNKLKALKRSMYGRAGTELLRARTLPITA